MKPEKVRLLRQKLEAVHHQFVLTRQIEKDAIAPALAFKDPLDQELIAFLCAVIAYGKIAHIQASARKLIAPMGDRPVQWLRKASPEQIRQATLGWNHRFNTDKDMQLLLLVLRQVYLNFSNLEEFVAPLDDRTSFDVIESMINKFQAVDVSPFAKLPDPGHSFWFLLPRPSAGSACKRLCLFLRWMVGQSEMDLKLWKSMRTKDLIIPVDTHLLKQARSLGLTRRKSADRKTALEITQKLRLLDATDPTRFDFALCHLGVKGEILRPGLESFRQG